MAVCGVTHAAALAGIVGVAHAHGPGWSLLALGVVAGFAEPPVSTTMRVEWGGAVATDERTAAYSLVYVTQELAILIGPLVLAVLIAASSASLALLAIAALTAAGGLGFSVSIGTPSGRGAPPAGSSRTLLGTHSVQLLLAVALLLGAMVGALEVAVPTLAAAHHAPAAAGVLIATVSVGGIIGAGVYGSRRWRTGPARRLLALLALLTASLALLTAAHSLVWVGALLLIAGLPLNPALATLSLLVDQHLHGRAAAEAFGWLSTAIAAGMGGGSAIAAAIAQHRPSAQPAFIAAAIAGAAATALAVSARHTLDGGTARTGRRQPGEERAGLVGLPGPGGQA
jgi:predicted MFS family arabinose efflux permease